MWGSALGVFIGAGLGALLRLALNVRLNAVSSTYVVGTLAANLVGGYLIGLIAGLMLYKAVLPESLRPLLITGFLGGLTTFSAFSLELAGQLNTGRTGLAVLVMAAHVGGSVVLTLAGLYSARLIAG